MLTGKADDERGHKGPVSEEKQLLLLAIVLSAIILFVGSGSIALLQAMNYTLGLVSKPDGLIVSASILNIALILFGWKRHRDLAAQLAATKQEADDAKRAASFDPLTGCYNRRSLNEAFDHLTRTGASTAAILLDLDNFKQINDAHGHRIGDLVLARSAHRIRSILPDTAMLARLGGDEFVCIVPFGNGNLAYIDQLTAAIVSTLAEPVELDGVPHDVTVSCGVVTDLEHDSRSQSYSLVDWLIDKADIAMYAAKRKGKNRFVWFDRSMEAERLSRIELERDIRLGLERDEFRPYYEQQIDLNTGKLVGFEMLARWNSPRLGLVRPDLFIPVAESMNVIAQLSEKLIGQAFQDAREWAGDLTLSVNISPIQLRDPWFSQKLLKLMIQHSFPPSRLEIEITENALHDDVVDVHAQVTSLRNQGVKVALDDFGTGYANWSQLNDLPFDRLKIDRSFVRRIVDEHSDTGIIDAILTISEKLGIPVTIEGIETIEALEALRDKPDIKVQGYHYGRPEDASAVVARLQRMDQLVEPTSTPEVGAQSARKRRRPLSLPVPTTSKVRHG